VLSSRPSLNYSNPQDTTLVGSTYLFCDGHSSTVGKITGYIVTTNTPCN
jgi:prepilin-type processing-associated H-X9-DG protein